MINKFKKPYFIAEIGSNFNQDLNTGYKLIDMAKNCGADAVKFQLFSAKKLYPNDKKMFKIFKSIEPAPSDNILHLLDTLKDRIDHDDKNACIEILSKNVHGFIR